MVWGCCNEFIVNRLLIFFVAIYRTYLKGLEKMINKLLKSLPVICGTMAFSVLIGIIFFGRSFGSMLPQSLTGLFYPGLVVSVIGLVFSLASAIVILKYFIFFTRTRVIDSDGNTLSDNKTLTFGSTRIHPIFIAAGGILLSMATIGLGFALMLDSVTMYAVRLFTIAALLLIIAGTIFLFSVMKHKIRRRFAWIASGILGVIALGVMLAAIPALSDLSVEDSELSAITATVVQTSSYTGFLTGPGKSVIRIKGTSGEIISLRYSGSRGKFRVGSKYTFYYLPNTRLIKKVNPAGDIEY